jgi:hypothetical protein
MQKGKHTRTELASDEPRGRLAAMKRAYAPRIGARTRTTVAFAPALMRAVAQIARAEGRSRAGTIAWLVGLAVAAMREHGRDDGSVDGRMDVGTKTTNG